MNRFLIEKCLDSLDIFKVLLDGIPEQKNRVIRDVLKNLEIFKYNSDDTIYDIGETANYIYLCLSGNVSIRLPEEAIKKNRSSHRLPGD